MHAMTVPPAVMNRQERAFLQREAGRTYIHQGGYTRVYIGVGGGVVNTVIPSSLGWVEGLTTVIPSSLG